MVSWETILSSTSLAQLLPTMTKKKVESLVQAARKDYFSGASTLLTDPEYDLLLEKLAALDPNSDVLHQVGISASRENKVALPYYMGSMNKLKTTKLIDRWTKKMTGPYVLGEKLDGISCLLVFRSATDEHPKMYTRGDGEMGRRIDHIWPHINQGKKKLNLSKHTVIRGELVVRKKDYQKVKDQFANPRALANSVVGSENSIDTRVASMVRLVVFEVLQPKMKPSKQMKWLTKAGFHTPVCWKADELSLDDLEANFQRFKADSDYPVDGIVIQQDEYYPNKHSENPKHAFAYKGITEREQTVVRGVEWNATKDGILYPRINFDSVLLDGSNIQYTSGFNANYIQKSKISPGAIITMIKSGDTIPHLLSIDQPGEPPYLPNQEEEYAWDENGVAIVLVNPKDNYAVMAKLLSRFLESIEVKGAGPSLSTKLVQAGHCSIKSIFKLTKGDLMELDGFAETSAEKTYQNLQTSLEKMEIVQFMVGTNLLGRGFGRRKCKAILKYYPNIISDYRKADRSEWFETLCQLDGFAEKTVTNFLDNLPKLQKLYRFATKRYPVHNPFLELEELSEDDQDMIGLHIVFSKFRAADWVTAIEARGGKVTGSMSKKVNLLVIDDKAKISQKIETARSNGVTIITKTAFAKKYELD